MEEIMQKKFIIFILFIMFFHTVFIGCATKMGLFKNIKVVRCEIPKIGAGTICTWIKITIEKENKKKDFVFYPNIVDKEFPIIGQKYDIYYTIEDIEGMIGLKDHTEVKNAKIVEKYIKK